MLNTREWAFCQNSDDGDAFKCLYLTNRQCVCVYVHCMCARVCLKSPCDEYVHLTHGEPPFSVFLCAVDFQFYVV